MKRAERHWERLVRRGEDAPPAPTTPPPPEGLPVPGVRVLARSETTDATITCTTDANGTCDLSGLAPGLWQVEAAHAGFVTWVGQHVVVADGATTWFPIGLQPVPMEDIVVTEIVTPSTVSDDG